ncbi:hypothetical protein [Nocardioides plantarum]|uniref:Uncharacterized protein n=1 Tax=Nocardioides plantarum TaxID=29299 RepID=A0ABV5KA12_9ACTN|nr:hypothetical protein [Nocardioides plantarum]
MADDDSATSPDTTSDANGSHRTRLESDRAEAGELVRGLTPRLVAELVGAAQSPRGSFRGCRGRAPEGIAAVEYVATVRIDAGPAAPDDLLQPVPAYLSGSDDVVESTVPGGRRLTAPWGDLTVTVTTRPAAGDFLLVTVTGGCHDIPADEQDEWLDRGVDDLT